MKTTISYIKKESEGVISEEIHLQVPDLRYPAVGDEVHLSLVQAHQLLKSLSEALSKYPF